MRRPCICAILFLVACGLSSGVRADDDFREINLMAGFQSLRVADGAFDIYSEDDITTSGSMGLEVELFMEFFLQLGVAIGETGSQLYEKWDTSVSVVDTQVSLRKGVTLLHAVRPYLLVGGTYSLVSSQIELWYPHKLRQEAGEGRWGGRFAAGCEFFLPRRLFRGGEPKGKGLFKDFTMGVGFEGGYMLKQPLPLDSFRQGNQGKFDEDPPMTPGKLELGELDLSGAYFAADFRFYF